jgi:hypothetical protein
MAANPGKLRIARNGFMMIHKAEGIAIGTGDELRAAGAMVDKYDDQIADIYAQRTGRTADEMRALYANGDFWMTGQEAVDQGFADVTFNDVQANLNIAARLDLTIYKNLPESVRAQIKPGNNKPDDDENRNFLQTQFDDMKKFFTNVINALKGVKPGEGQPLTAEAIATAITQPFEAIGDELDTQITNRVNEQMKGDAITQAISTQVAALDMSAGITAQLTAMINATDNNPVRAMVSTMVEDAIKPLREKNVALEQEITNLKGGAGNKGGENSGGEGGYVPKGKFQKA